MTIKKSLAMLAMSVMVVTLTACGEARLADDPEVESPAAAQELPDNEPAAPTPVVVAPVTGAQESLVLAKYDHLDPNRVVPTNLLKKAVLYFEANSSKFPNKSYLSVIDFSARSTKARFFVINMSSGSVWAMHVAHGKNSDTNQDGYAESFSNNSGSNQSSIGVYKAAETYYGAHGLSLRLDGLSSTNSKARARAIVIHGADYVQDAAVVQGRSWGCPAISMSNRDSLIAKIKNGSMIYAGLSAQ